MFLRVIELCLYLLIVGTLVSQIAIPLWRGTPLFPIFRKETKLEGEIANAKQKGVERELRKKLGDLDVVEVDVPTTTKEEK